MSEERKVGAHPALGVGYGSKMKIVFRVVARTNVVLFESGDYADCEKFCWDFGKTKDAEVYDELQIEKKWVPKSWDYPAL